MEERQLLYNAIQTKDGTILHSKHQHDFIYYLDKSGEKYILDGGNSYRRIMGPKDLKDLAVYDDGTHETRRKYLHWGRNFDKDMNRLKETEWVPIKDLETDHIENILEGGYSDHNTILHETLEQELVNRKNKK